MNINLKLLLLAGAAMGIASAASAAKKATAKSEMKPNVIIILTDDLGYNDLSCYGNPDFQTPNIDRMAEQGMRFTQAYCPASVSTPSRYGLLTGRNPWRTFLKSNVISDSPSLIEPDRYTLPKLFKEEGYRTCCIGKWHLGFNDGDRNTPINYNIPTKIGPNEIGFDYFFGLPVGHFYPPLVFMENHSVVGLDPKDPISVNKKPAGGGKPVTVGGKSALYDEYQVNQTLFTKAKEFVASCKGNPFFLYFATTIPHAPYMVHPDFQNSGPMSKYGDVLRELDASIGRFMLFLKEQGLDENTLLIFTSDNGGVTNKSSDFYGELGISHLTCDPLRGSKGNSWEGGLRIPFIVRYPGVVRPGVVSNEVICSTDFMAAFADMLGRQLPKGAGPDSFDVLPALLYNQPLPVRPFAQQSRGGIVGLRYGDWKYIPINGNGDNVNLILNERNKPKDIDRKQLYNMATDYLEKNNVIDRDSAKVAEMKAILEQILAQPSVEVWGKMGIKYR